MNSRERMFNVPGIVVWMAGLLVAVHVARQLVPVTIDLYVQFALGFIPLRYDAAGIGFPGGQIARLVSPLTYASLHADFLHLGVNILWMAGFGSAVARRFGALRFTALFVLGALGGAAAHYIALADDAAVMVGASAAISAMTAATARFAFAPGGPLAGGGVDTQAYRIPAPSLSQTLANPRALIFIAVWFAINIIFGVQGILTAGDSASIAWQAHIGGFLAGLFFFKLLDPVKQDPGDSPRYVAEV